MPLFLFPCWGTKDFDTRRKEEAFKKQKEENFSSEVFPWSSFDDEDDDDSDDDSDDDEKKKSSGRARRRHRGREIILLPLIEDVPLHRYEIVLIEKSSFEGFR